MHLLQESEADSKHQVWLVNTYNFEMKQVNLLTYNYYQELVLESYLGKKFFLENY